MKSIPVSVVILCHNERTNLERCIGALQDFAEVVVLDDGSTDGSQELAESIGARVVNHPFLSFADQRNWAMEGAELSFDWVFHLDADEVMTSAANEEIRESISFLKPNQVGWVARKMMLDECWLRHSADYPVYVPRLVHQAGPRYIMRGHGEVIDAPESDFVFCSEPLFHYVFSKGWTDWYERHDRYAKAEAKRILDGLPPLVWRHFFAKDRTVRRGVMRTLSYRLPARPLLRFLYAYVFRFGFLDGKPGLDFCRAMAKYERMIDRELR